MTPAAGQPGIGAFGAPSSNGISQVQLGSINRTAPSAVDSQALAVSALNPGVHLPYHIAHVNHVNGNPQDAGGGNGGVVFSNHKTYSFSQ